MMSSIDLVTTEHMILLFLTKKSVPEEPECTVYSAEILESIVYSVHCKVYSTGILECTMYSVQCWNT